MASGKACAGGAAGGFNNVNFAHSHTLFAPAAESGIQIRNDLKVACFQLFFNQLLKQSWIFFRACRVALTDQKLVTLVTIGLAPWAQCMTARYVLVKAGWNALHQCWKKRGVLICNQVAGP